jgi:UDP-N-acetyl-D-glucosamine dehydrogenase
VIDNPADAARPQLDLVIVGLGCVGLPLARIACELGWRVAGYELDASRVSLLRDGKSVVDDVSDADVEQMSRSGFVATGDSEVLGRAATVVICVPTPLSDDRQPDLLFDSCGEARSHAAEVL